MKLSTNFTLEEMTYNDTAIRKEIENVPDDNQLKNLASLCNNVLEEIEQKFGSVKITSGFRCPELNQTIGGSKSSQHCLGEAADLHVLGYSVEELFQKIKATNIPYDQLIQEFDRWVHVSYSPRNRRQCLRAVKSGGKTVYEVA